VSVLEQKIKEYTDLFTSESLDDIEVVKRIHSNFKALVNENNIQYIYLADLIDGISNGKIRHSVYRGHKDGYFVSEISRKGSFSKYPKINKEVTANMGVFKYSKNKDFLVVKTNCIKFLRENFEGLYEAFEEVFRR